MEREGRTSKNGVIEQKSRPGHSTIETAAKGFFRLAKEKKRLGVGEKAPTPASTWTRRHRLPPGASAWAEGSP